MNLIKKIKSSTLEKIKKNGFELRNASTFVRADKEIVLIAVKQNGLVLYYASKILQDDKEVVLEAVKQNAWALEYASDNLQNDKELLEILEKTDKSDESNWSFDEIIWYGKKMQILANFKEKEFMENSITTSNNKSKKVKF